MERSRVAEFVLSCVLPAERAAAVTGDFLEEAEKRGRVWFWSSVARTAASRVMNDFRERPLAMMGVGAAGYLRSGGILAVVLVAYWMFTHLAVHHMGEGVMVNVAPPGTPPDLEPRWVIAWSGNFLWAVWLYDCGRWTARRMPGFEIASAVSAGAFGWMAILAASIYLHLFVPGGSIDPSVWHDLPLIAGAIVERRLRTA